MSQNQIVVRRAAAKDIPAMVELWKEYMEFHRAAGSPYAMKDDGPKRWAESASEHIASDKSCVLVAESSGRVIGMAVSHVTRRPPVIKQDRYGTIVDVAVTERFRCKGIGQRLFEETKKWFSDHEINRIELRVLTSNPTASAFWRQMGFKPYIEVRYLNL
jgi:GNAT superfamily N-acetyltransferase